MSAPITFTHPREEELAMHLTKFPEALEDMLEELAPNRYVCVCMGVGTHASVYVRLCMRGESM